MVILKKADTFLIRVDSTRKNYVPKNYTTVKGKPIFAEDVLLHNRFKLDKASMNDNPDFTKAKPNDYMVVFCNSLVPHSPNQIKFIFKIATKIDNQMVLKPFTKLKMGYPLDHLISLINEGKLSEEMNKCLTDGYKICQIEFSDLELLINYDPLVRKYHSTSWKL